MKKMTVLEWIILTFFITVIFPSSLHTKDCYAQGAIPKISNLKISPNPATYGEDIWIVFEFEDDDADVDKFFIENTWETKEGKIESKVHQYNLASDIRDKNKGEIKKSWKVASKEHKDYRILKVWVIDKKYNQSNILSEELKLIQPPPIALGDRCEAPVWNIGDKWTYRTSSGREFSAEVMEIKEDLVIVKWGKSLMGYDNKTFNLKYTIDDKGNKRKVTSGFPKLLNFPMVMGKKWTDVVSGRDIMRNFLNEYRIQGIEEINTPVGTFKAYKIHCQHTDMSDSRVSGYAIFWYSPEVKNWIKREYQPGFWAPEAEDAMIIRFKFK